MGDEIKGEEGQDKIRHEERRLDERRREETMRSEEKRGIKMEESERDEPRGDGSWRGRRRTENWGLEEGRNGTKMRGEERKRR